MYILALGYTRIVRETIKTLLQIIMKAYEINGAVRGSAIAIARVAKNHGYGFGELSFYFKELEKDLIDEGATKEQAYEARQKCEAQVEILIK